MKKIVKVLRFGKAEAKIEFRMKQGQISYDILNVRGPKCCTDIEEDLQEWLFDPEHKNAVKLWMT